jgi:hypothetical protein
MAESTNQQQLP